MQIGGLFYAEYSEMLFPLIFDGGLSGSQTGNNFVMPVVPEWCQMLMRLVQYQSLRKRDAI